MEFDNIKKTVIETAQTAGKKAGEVANKAKIKFALANLQADLDELYEELGRLHYEAIANGTPGGARESALLTKIDSVKTDMEILKSEIGQPPKKGKLCTSCGKYAPKNVTFCPYCGAEFNY